MKADFSISDISPDGGQAENIRQSLKNYLQEKAILFPGSANSDSGAASRSNWLFYNWNISLNETGMRLSSLCLLEKLHDFQSTQLVSYGLTSLPIVTALVAWGGGKYSGLAIREKREEHGTCNQIEGVGEKRESVLLIDDCIATGRSMYKAVSILENEGYTVEGCLCLLNIPNQGGIEWARSMGYRVEAIFEAYRDIDVSRKGITGNPLITSLSWDPVERLPEELSPADAARKIIEHYVQTGTILLPPPSLRGTPNGNGGVFVSIRDKSTNKRISREGFFNFNPAERNFYHDLAEIIVKTIEKYTLEFSRTGLEHMKIAVTAVSLPEKIKPSRLDHHSLGIICKSEAYNWKTGAALPDMHFISSEIEQYQHALKINGGIHKNESFTLYGHYIEKYIETGADWPGSERFLTGTDNKIMRKYDAFGEIVCRRVKSWLLQFAGSRDSTPLLEEGEKLPLDITGIGVSIYHNGMVGCWTSFSKMTQTCIYNASLGAWTDDRYILEKTRFEIEESTIIISLFHQEAVLGFQTADNVSKQFRLGEDSLFVRKKEKNAIILSYIPCHFGWSAKQMAENLLKKAGIEDNTGYWRVYKTDSFLMQGEDIHHISNGYFRQKNDFTKNKNYEGMARSLARYILGQNKGGGLPEYCNYPFYNHSETSGSLIRVLLAIRAVSEAGQDLKDQKFIQSAESALAYTLDFLLENQDAVHLSVPGYFSDELAEANLLILLLSKRNKAGIEKYAGLIIKLKEKISTWFQANGLISPSPLGKRANADVDFLPAASLLAMSLYYQYAEEAHGFKYLNHHLEFCRRNFQLQHSWAMVWWQMQAWTAVYDLTKNPAHAAFVFEMADWALDFQLDKNGAFLIDYDPHAPGFHTACVLEGMADAWSLSLATDDKERSAKYSNSWHRGIHFMEQLMTTAAESRLMARGEYAVGGVRQSLINSTMRIDYTAHLLIALLKGMRNLTIGRS